MAAFKCKMCGGDLLIEAGMSVCECEYCGTKQTVPNADNEKKMTLFARAGRLLRSCEFDKAAGVFETIVGDYPEEAEAYWGLVLCHYGIEYVDDPATGKKVPTCHRSSFDSVLDNDNFEQACENADGIARRVYREEARAIEELRKGIIEVSGKEEPYDIFISYKETDANGNRTLDSVLAQDMYDALTEKGYRVFFSRITLEDKLGTEYEPYIFAALNSAKVMLVVGTDYDHFDAVWVKNEWNRFLKLIAAGQKKTLIPCYKNMDAYDMPKEFAKLTAQDMGKVGAMQDLLRGVGKIVKVEEKPFIHEQTESSFAEMMKIIKRKQEQYNEAKALMSEAKSEADYKNVADKFAEIGDFEDAKELHDVAMKKAVEAYISHRDKLYWKAYKTKERAKTENDYLRAADQFEKIIDYKDSAILKEECLRLSVPAKEEDLRRAKKVKKSIAAVSGFVAILVIIVGLVVPFFAAKDFANKCEQVAEFYADGEFSAAQQLLTELNQKNGYPYYFSTVHKAKKELSAELFASNHTNYPIYYGNYNLDENKVEFDSIEWIILEKNENEALLLSRYVISTEAYAYKLGRSEWANSLARKECEGILKLAFMGTRKNALIPTILETDSLSTKPVLTDDTVFLLSAEEVERYIPNLEDRIASSGVIPKGQSQIIEGGVSWWLRTPGDTERKALYVNSSGKIVREGGSNNVAGGIRPAILVDMSKLIDSGASVFSIN